MKPEKTNIRINIPGYKDWYEKNYVINYWKKRALKSGLPWEDIEDLVRRLYSEDMSGAADWFEDDLDDDGFIKGFLDDTDIMKIDDFLTYLGDCFLPPLKTREDMINAYAEGLEAFFDAFHYFDYNDEYVILGCAN